MNALAETSITAHPMLAAFFQAQHINQHSGGAVIAPWDIEPGHSLDEWAEAALMLSDLPFIRKRKKAEQQVFEKVRRENKDYSRIHYRH